MSVVKTFSIIDEAIVVSVGMEKKSSSVDDIGSDCTGFKGSGQETRGTV